MRNRRGGYEFTEAVDLSRIKLPKEGAPKLPPPRAELLWIGIDLDGTLAEPVWTPGNPTSEIGDPIWRNVDKLIEVTTRGFRAVIHTSRPWTDHENVKTWLRHYNIPYEHIQMGKPLYRLYIDDRARHSEEESWLP